MKGTPCQLRKPGAKLLTPLIIYPPGRAFVSAAPFKRVMKSLSNLVHSDTRDNDIDFALSLKHSSNSRGIHDHRGETPDDGCGT